jgi:hypothetical protein
VHSTRRFGLPMIDVENTNIDVENANIDVEITNIDV